MILVTGGTGFVGSHLVARLVQSGERVRCLVRNPDEATRRLPPEVELIQGEVTLPKTLAPAMLGVEILIHLVAIIREKKGATFAEVNVQGVGNVVEAARKAGVPRLIHLSSLGATPNPKYRFAHSKWQGEEVVRRSGLRNVIFRPSVMFGQGFSFINRIVQSLHTFPFIAPVPGSGKARFQPIWVEDTISCVLKTLKDEAASGQTFEIGGPEYLTYEEILDLVLQAKPWRRFKVHLPLFWMKPAVWAMERFIADPPVTSGELTQLELDNVTDLDSVQRHFGFKPRSLRQGLHYLRAA